MSSHIHLAGVRLPDSARASLGLVSGDPQPAMCLFIRRADIASDEGLRDALRGLADVSRTLSSLAVRYDELLLSDPVVRERVTLQARTAFDSGDIERLGSFLEWWPSAFYLPEVSGRLALEVLDFKPDVFKVLARRLQASAAAFPKENSLDLARDVSAELRLNELRGVKQPIKAVLAEVVGAEEFMRRERRIRDNLESVRRHSDRISPTVVGLQTCDQHAGCHGLFQGGPPVEVVRATQSESDRAANAVSVVQEVDGSSIKA